MSLVPGYLVVFGVFIFLALFSYSVYMNIKLGITILRVQDSIEECLDIIDERYNSISKVLEIPIFFDSLEVRQVVNDIGATRDALLLVANRLSEDVKSDESVGES